MRNARNPFLLPALAATLCCMVVPLFKLALLEWGAPDPETALFLEQYLAGRGVLESVFDPLRNDWGFYQGRELSYFFDRLDALWIGWSARHGILHFCSLWALLFTAGSVFVQQYAIRQLMPKLPSWQAGMISLLYLLLPQSGNAVYFRSAKPGAAFCLTTAGFLLLALARAPRSSPSPLERGRRFSGPLCSTARERSSPPPSQPERARCCWRNFSFSARRKPSGAEPPSRPQPPSRQPRPEPSAIWCFRRP